MLVSSRPRTGRSLVGTIAVLVGGSVLIGAERCRVNRGRVAGHAGELVAADEPATTQRDQLTNPVAVASDREGLAALDSVHDLARPVPQVPLGYLGVRGHLLR